MAGPGDGLLAGPILGILRYQVCKATRLNLRTASPPEPYKVLNALHLFKKIILATGRDQETLKWGKKRNFIPKQNTHDLLVGALSIGIPSNNLYFKRVTQLL